MASSETNRFASSSDSGVFLLDPADRKLLKACADAWQREEDAEAEAHRRFLKIARDLPAVRLERVMEIRRRIADGTYVTEEKLNATIDRLLSALRG